jgi:hypothetical protein
VPLLEASKKLNEWLCSGEAIRRRIDIPDEVYDPFDKALSKYTPPQSLERGYHELIIAYENYIDLLANEIDSMSSIAYLHGYRSERYEIGKAMRFKISQLKHRFTAANVNHVVETNNLVMEV